MKQIIIILMVVTSFCSCETVVDIEVPERDPKLVLNAYISPDSLWHIRLTHSKHVLDNSDYQEITNAEVLVFENGELKESLFHQVVNDANSYNVGYYRSLDHRPQPGNLYRVEAAMNGYEPVWAETRIPDLVSIEQFTIDTTRLITRDYSSGYKLAISFNDPSVARNYYQVELIAKTVRSDTYLVEDGNGNSKDTTVYYTNTSSVYIEPLDPLISDEQFGYYNPVIFTDATFNGSNYQFEFLVDAWWITSYIDPGNTGENVTLFIVLRNINEEMYLYETTADLQYWNSDNPFAEPVPVFNNVNNGFGVLGAFAADTSTLIIKK